jgi:hypothetical protein
MAFYLYSTEFLEPLSEDDFRRLIGQLPNALQPKFLLYCRCEDAHANLLGK